MNDYIATTHPPLHPMMTEPAVYTALNIVFLALTLFTHYWFLLREEGWMKRMPRRWAGLNWWGYWIPWLVSLLIVAASYGVFFFLFVVSDDYATHNSMYHPVCLCGLGFAAAGGILFPYYVRRAENSGFSMSVSDECWCVEAVCTCTLCVGQADALSRKSVFPGLVFSVLCSCVMLGLFCAGVAGSEGHRDRWEWIAAALAYMCGHSIVCDLAFWGPTWHGELVSEGCCKFVNKSSQEDPPPTASHSAFPWPNVPLVDFRTPLLPLTRPLSVETMDGERWAGR